MAQIIGLPKLSPTMEEGVLVRWVKKEGDKVSPGDLVAEVETDKANMDFNIEDEGVLLKLLVKEGETVKLGAPVAILGEKGEDISGLKPEEPKQAEAPKEQPKEEPKEEQKEQPKPVAKAPEPASGKLLASPLAKTLAIELGIDLRTIKGTGPGGRIVERDVRGGAPKEETAIVRAEAPPPPAVPEGDYTDVPASNMRKRIAARLTEAKRDVPHFYLMRTIDAAPLLGFRGRLNELLGDRGKVSVNDLVIKAVALALRRVPDCNASWNGDSI